MGGLLTLELARAAARRSGGDLRHVGAAVAAAAGGEVRRTSWRGCRSLRRAALPKLAGSDIRDPEMKRRNHDAVPRAGMPLPALASLVELGAHLRDELGDVTTPTLLIHSERDHTVPYDCMDAIAHRLGTAEYKKVTLHESFT